MFKNDILQQQKVKNLLQGIMSKFLQQKSNKKDKNIKNGAPKNFSLKLECQFFVIFY